MENKKPIKLTQTEREYLKLKISGEMNRNPEFKTKVEEMARKREQINNES